MHTRYHINHIKSYNANPQPQFFTGDQPFHDHVATSDGRLQRSRCCRQRFSRASLLRCSGCRNTAEMDGSYLRTRINPRPHFGMVAMESMVHRWFLLRRPLVFLAYRATSDIRVEAGPVNSISDMLFSIPKCTMCNCCSITFR